jgi:hypothetical protein
MTTYVSEPGNIWDFFFPKKQEEKQAAKKTLVSHYVKGEAPEVSLPKASTGSIAPFIFGRELIKNPDLMWYGNLKPISHVTSSQETVTDPSTGDQTITTTYTTTITGYSVDVQLCLGLGPGMRLRSILLDNAPIWSGTIGPARTAFAVTGNAIIGNVIFAGGNFDQAVDPYLQGIIPQAMPAYRGVAYLVIRTIDTTKLGNISIEVDRYPDVLGLGAENKIGDDINPVSAIASIVTSKWGGAGRDVATLGTSFADLAHVCFTEGNGCSVTNRSVASANDLNSILLDQINAIMWEDHTTGKLELTSVRKDFDRTNLVRLFDRDITSVSQMEKGSWQITPTNLVLQYVDRLQGYVSLPIAARNLGASSKIKKSTLSLSYPAVRVGTLAAKILAREGASSGSPTQLVQITTNRKAAACNPGDIVLITCEKYHYFSVPGIVLKRRTQPITDNSVTLTVSVILYPNNNLLFAAPEVGFYVPPDPNPHAPTLVKIMSAPWAFKQPITWPAFSGNDYKYVGDVVSDNIMVFSNAYNAPQQALRGYYHYGSAADIVFYSNGVSYNALIAGTDFQYTGYGKLTGSIDKFDNWDDSSATFTITLHNVGPSELAMQNMQAAFGSILENCVVLFIGDEIFTMSRAHDFATASINYNAVARTVVFTGMRRGIADTVAQSHAADSDVFFAAYNATVYTSKLGFTFGTNVHYTFTGMASPKNVLTESPLASGYHIDYVGTDRANRPLRPHNTKINGSRGTSSPTALVRGSTPTISWFIRARGRTIGNNMPQQSVASQIGEVTSSRHLVYRVMITDSAAVDWDCGATSDTVDTSSLVITVPLGAAAGNGLLWTQAEFNPGSGTKVSMYHDKLPVNLT